LKNKFYTRAWTELNQFMESADISRWWELRSSTYGST